MGDIPDSRQAASLAQELRALTGALKRRLREQGQAADLTPSQISVLLRLERDGPATASALARAEGMRPQSMGPIVSALADLGLVGSAQDPADGRQTLLSLTPACRERILEDRAARQDWLTRTIEARLSVHEQQQLAAAVVLLRRLIHE